MDDDFSRSSARFSKAALIVCLVTSGCRSATYSEDVFSFDDCMTGRRDAAVRLETDLGAIDMQLFGARAPISTCNFLRYVTAHRYDGGVFFRTVRPDNQKDKAVKISVVQADINESAGGRFAPIPLERTSETGLRHVDGAVSMARGEPDTATSSIFISVDAQPDLDYGGRRNPDKQGFAVFGRVICGMDIVREIWSRPSAGEQLTPPVAIRSARVLESSMPGPRPSGNGECAS